MNQRCAAVAVFQRFINTLRTLLYLGAACERLDSSCVEFSVFKHFRACPDGCVWCAYVLPRVVIDCMVILDSIVLLPTTALNQNCLRAVLPIIDRLLRQKAAKYHIRYFGHVTWFSRNSRRTPWNLAPIIVFISTRGHQIKPKKCVAWSVSNSSPVHVFEPLFWTGQAVGHAPAEVPGHFWWIEFNADQHELQVTWRSVYIDVWLYESYLWIERYL